MEKINSIIYGKMSEVPKESLSWGKVGKLFSNWGELKINGYLIEFIESVEYSKWADIKSENLCLVEDGEATLLFNNKEYCVRKGYVFKIYPNQNVKILLKSRLLLTSIQMITNLEFFNGEDLNELKLINPDDVPVKVYEYESLGQEIITCKYEPGIGLLKFTFPINKIPIHKHPFSGRLIRPISGKGFSYVDPHKYEMNEGTFILFPKGTIHTNGPLPGDVFTLWAVQLPWIDSKIDEENIAGTEEFVRYIESTPPKELWKTKQDFLRVIDKLSK